MNRSEFAECAASLGLILSESQLIAFERFEEALHEANKTRNLTRVPREHYWLRHFAESLLFHDLIPIGANLLDIGSGPGFPAWPLACARPDLQVTAMDSNGKMIEFLRSRPLPNLLVVQARAEESDMREAFDCITGRALAPLTIQLEISAQLAKVGGTVIPMRTAKDVAPEDETLGELGLKPREVRRVELPGISGARIFPVYTKVRQTSRKYPRRWAEMLRRPLPLSGRSLFEQDS